MDFNAWLIDVSGQIDGFHVHLHLAGPARGIVGIYYTIRTKAVQIRYIKDMFTQITEKKHVEGKRSISSFQALMVSTASRVGTGNIAGVATALATGGPGAVFWMGLMAIVGAASAFIESTLAQIWKVRGKDGEFRGGPAYYIHQALGKPRAGRAVLRAAHPVLRFRLQRPAGVQRHERARRTTCPATAQCLRRPPSRRGIVLAADDRRRHLRRNEAHQRHHVDRGSRHGASPTSRSLLWTTITNIT